MECLPASSACVLCTLADWVECTPRALRKSYAFFDRLHQVANESVAGTDAEAHQVIEHALSDLVVYGFDRSYIDATYAKEQVKQEFLGRRRDKRSVVRALRRAARLSSSNGTVTSLR